MKRLKNETVEQFEQRQREGFEISKKRKYKTGNPKKHPAWSRRYRNRNLPKPNAVFLPWFFQNIGKFHGSSGPHKQINHDLFRRASVARRDGGYFRFQEMDKK